MVNKKDKEELLKDIPKRFVKKSSGRGYKLSFFKKSKNFKPGSRLCDIEKKLLLVNGLHACAAYLGYTKKLECVFEVFPCTQCL